MWWKIKDASRIKNSMECARRKRIKSEVKKIKKGIETEAFLGEDHKTFYYTDYPNVNTGWSVYTTIATELILRGYEVKYRDINTGGSAIVISWKRGGVGPYQIEERMQEYYKTLREIKKHADDSN